MVVARGEPKLLKIGIDLRADRFLCAKVEWRAVHTEDAPRGELLLADLGEAVGIQPYCVIEHIGAVLTVEVEVGVIGEVDHGVLVANGGILDLERVVLRQAIQHRSIERAGITLLRRRTFNREFNRVIFDNAIKEAVCKRAVKMVFALILLQVIGLAVQGECGVADAVRVSSDKRTEKAAALFIIGSVLIAEGDVPKHAVPIGHNDTLYRTAVINDGDLHPALVFHDEPRHAFAVFDRSERLCDNPDHDIAPITCACACCSL